MGTAERREAPGGERVTRGTAERGAAVAEHAEHAPAEYANSEYAHAEYGDAAHAGVDAGGRPAAAEEQARIRPLWVEEPARRHPLPDPVRTAAVRAVLIIAVTLIQATVAFLCTMAGSWLAFPMVLSSVVSTVVATWAVLDVWVTRQVWSQRHGVVTEPSSAARALRRERRRARRRARAEARAQERIRRRGRAGQLSHS
ncbi:hypothetical protein ACFOOM_19645 [Streptomyces echinoruber]